ncbi:amino acid ABC transporter substrate-binding protein [Haloarculaceae archaeon H-GB2-1]|nr:amino acid ABC transporter substrate-binding protein [Haloarculaceae archaeon H-GB1-1]MEA5408637.1 amino acid ABC transporter substrate-binding protein [Haloarculaceae archaeon H-GB2-1]
MADSNRRSFLKLAGTTGAIALAGCSQQGDNGDGGSGDGATTASSGDSGPQTITLGGTMSLSGDNADLGKLYKQAYELTIQRINDAGGVEGGDGNTYELEMVLRDDETDASKSKRTYQELIDSEGIDYLLGPYSSTVTLPASAVAAKNQKPMVEGGGASPEIFMQDNKWIFGLLPTADKYALSSVDMAKAQSPSAETAALLAEDDTFSQSTAKGVRAYMDNQGVDLVVDESFPSGTSDLSTNLGKVRDSDADILLLAAHQKHAIVMAKQLESQKVNVDMAMATVGSLNQSFKDETGANGDYVYGPSSWAINADFEDPVYGSTSDFASAIESEYGNTPDYHSAAGESVILTYMKAFEQVDELTPTKVRNAIRDIEFTSAYGNIAFDEKGVIDKEMLVYQWQPENGKQIVWPEAVQQSAPVYPMPDWSER